MKKVALLLCGLLALIPALTHALALGPYEATIVNGDEVNPGEIPYQVSLQRYGAHFCGGSIVNEYWVVTAAQCVIRKETKHISVAAGSVYCKGPTQISGVAKLVVHEEYSHWDWERNDIALIKVKTPFEFNDLVKPVELTEQGALVTTGAEVVVSGWGYTGYENPEIQPHLLKAKINIADPYYCKEVLKKINFTIYATNVCAYDSQQRRGPCCGDSGGPLTYGGKLVGIVSWSIDDPNCASTEFPAVYTRVSEYVEWIKEHAQ